METERRLIHHASNALLVRPKSEVTANIDDLPTRARLDWLPVTMRLHLAMM